MFYRIESLAGVVAPWMGKGWRTADAVGASVHPIGASWWSDGVLAFPMHQIRRPIAVKSAGPESSMFNRPAAEFDRLCADLWAQALEHCTFEPGYFRRGIVGPVFRPVDAVWIGYGFGDRREGAALNPRRIAAAIRHAGADGIRLDVRGYSVRAALLVRGITPVGLLSPMNVAAFVADDEREEEPESAAAGMARAFGVPVEWVEQGGAV